MCVCVCVNMCIYTERKIPFAIHNYMQTYIHTYMHACRHTYVCYIHTYDTCRQAGRQADRQTLQNTHACMKVCMSVKVDCECCGSRHRQGQTFTVSTKAEYFT